MGCEGEGVGWGCCSSRRRLALEQGQLPEDFCEQPFVSLPVLSVSLSLKPTTGHCDPRHQSVQDQCFQ